MSNPESGLDADRARLEQIRKESGYERVSTKVGEYVASGAEIEQENKARELASAIERYKAKRADVEKAEAQLKIVSARITNRDTTPEIRGSAMKMQELIESVKEASEFELRKLGESILQIDPSAELPN
jgi:hypothetical protein